VDVDAADLDDLLMRLHAPDNATAALPTTMIDSRGRPQSALSVNSADTRSISRTVSRNMVVLLFGRASTTQRPSQAHQPTPHTTQVQLTSTVIDLTVPP
jgi:hypothetical protein